MSEQIKLIMNWNGWETWNEDVRFESMFDFFFKDTSICIPYSNSMRVVLYHRWHNWKGRGEDSFDDYTDTEYAEYNLENALSYTTDDGATVDSLFTALKYDGAVTVPIRRHRALLRFLVQNESLLWSCSRDYLIKSRLMYYFGDYDYSCHEMSMFEISKKGKPIVQYDYTVLRPLIYMDNGVYYPCCINLSVPQLLIEHPEAMIRVFSPEILKYVIVNLYAFYQRHEAACKLQAQIHRNMVEVKFGQNRPDDTLYLFGGEEVLKCF